MTDIHIATGLEVPPCERCYWVVPGAFLAGAYPGSPDPQQHQGRIGSPWESGIRTFISLMEPNETNNAGAVFTPYDAAVRKVAQGEAVECLRFPVRDLLIPTEAVMREILDAIDRSLAASSPVYLHCFGGVGRTGTVVCCWLLRHNFVTPDNVLQVLRDLRRADKTTARRKAPETAEQIRFVATWKS